MRILFVCSGNTCRSPMAQALFNKIAKENNIDAYAESAGIAAYSGDTASENAISTMESYGIDLRKHRSRPFSQYMIDNFDLFVCMTQAHKNVLMSVLKEEKIIVLGDGIFDPYGGDIEVYKKCAEEIKDAVDLLIKNLFEIKIHPMVESNVKDIAEIEKECFSSPWSEDAIKGELSNETARFFVAELFGKIVGYIGMHIILDECYIANIATTKTMRRKGIAAKLLERAIDAALNEKCSFISLEVRKSNEAAKALYKKNDFKICGVRKNFYVAPNENALIMTRYFDN